MGCHDIYRICYDNGFTKLCECSKDKMAVLEHLHIVLEQIRNSHSRLIDKYFRNYPDKLCMFRPGLIRELGSIVECLRFRMCDREKFFNTHKCEEHDGECEEKYSEYLKTHCPSVIICDEKYLCKIYTTNSHEWGHPDMLIVKGKNVTVIVEEKRFGAQGAKSFREQLTQSYELLPGNLRSPCTFIVYRPKAGGTLPKGFCKHSKLLLLTYDRKTISGSLPLFEVPVIILEESLYRYIRRK